MKTTKTEALRQAAAEAYRSGSPDYQEKEKEWYKTLAETEENPTVKAAYEKLSK